MRGPDTPPTPSAATAGGSEGSGQPPDTSVTLASAGLAVALIFTFNLVFQGLPGFAPIVERATGQRPTWTGVGRAVDDRLGPGPVFEVERLTRVGRVEARSVVATTAAHEVGLFAGKALALLVLLAWLRARRSPAPRLLPDVADRARALDVLTWVVPVAVLLAVGLGLWGAGAGGGPARGLVGGLAAPALGHPLGALLFALRLVVLVPLVEEVAWRHFVYGGLRTRLSPLPASVIGALLFGLAHVAGGWDHPAPLLLQYGFALLAQHLVERRPESLGAPILLHAVGNALAVGLFAAATLAPDELLALFGAL